MPRYEVTQMAGPLAQYWDSSRYVANQYEGSQCETQSAQYEGPLRSVGSQSAQYGGRVEAPQGSLCYG